MKSILGVYIFLAIALISLTLISINSEGSPDLFIDDAEYSNDQSQTRQLIVSGRDNATNFKYLIIDDISESPENWSMPEYNDTSWSLGAAPFGDRPYNGEDQNTDWDTSGNSPYSNDVILIRHKFHVSGTVTSAEINVAFANYCTPYLNGDLIYSESGGNSHGMEYWNDDGTSSIQPSSFNNGENVLAVYGRDYVGQWGNNNRQWLDLQLTAQVFEPTNESIILGDTVKILIDGGNKGNQSAETVFLNSTTDHSNNSSDFFAAIPENYNGKIFINWIPEKIGLNQLNITFSCNCNETNLTNNYFILNVTTKIYSLNTSFDKELILVNQSRIISSIIQVNNNGNLTDNITLDYGDPMLSNWNIQFTPNNFLLEPGQTQNVLLTASIPDTYDDGFYNLSFKVQSTYDYVLTRTILTRGENNNNDWKWINSTGPEKLYNNTNWTKNSFNDTSWNEGNTPFGDNDLGGISYQTFWDGDNYGYFRHVINIDNIDLYDEGLMTIRVSKDDSSDSYVNGILVFGDLDQTTGGAEYWNDEYQIFVNYLTSGENVFSTIVRNNGNNAQWFDQEVIMQFPQGNLWNYKTEMNEIPIYLDSTPPTSSIIKEGFYRNNSTFEVKWRSISDYEDLEGYYIYYSEKDGNNIGEWISLGFYTNTSMNFTGQNGMIYRFKSVAIDTLGNIEDKGSYDTEMNIDLDLPQSNLWIVEGDFEFTNLDGVTFQWKNNLTYDIQAYLIEYREVGNLTWNDYGSFTAPGQYWFSPTKDATFEIRSRTVDYAGNIEIKVVSDVIITFDRTSPIVKLNPINAFIGSEDLIISILYSNENLNNITLEYAQINENDENELDWRIWSNNWENESPIINLLDGKTYYFRINPMDFAGNDYPRDTYQLTIAINSEEDRNIELPIFPLKPVMIGKIRNMAISVDEEGDGIFEKSLEEYTGTDLTGMTANQYWIDYANSKVIFGDGDDGYLPPINSSISFIYQGFDLKTTVDTTPPEAVTTASFVIEERNNVTIKWELPLDAVNFIIESKRNFTSDWLYVSNLDNNDTNELKYEIVNLSNGFHYYRITSIDRMGYTNSDMENKFLEIFIETEVINEVIGEEKGNDGIYLNLGAAVLLISIALFSASYLFKENKSEEIVNDGPVLTPIENYEGEPLSEEINQNVSFSVISGSEFSRQVSFICEAGCLNEFKGKYDDKEIMCPHCGSIGESPL